LTEDPDFHTTWSLEVGNKRRQKSVKELADHLRYIIREEKKYDIPEEPYVETPQPVFVFVIGTRTKEFDDINKKYENEATEIKKTRDELKKEREARGEGSAFSTLQPWFMPSIESLDKKRIDVLIPYDIIGKDNKKETVLRWCQGKVKEVYNQEEIPFTVRVEWDPTPDINGGKESVETDGIRIKN